MVAIKLTRAVCGNVPLESAAYFVKSLEKRVHDWKYTAAMLDLIGLR